MNKLGIMHNPQLKTVECPECGGKAKLVSGGLMDMLTGKSSALKKYKCTKCGIKFPLVF
jgi:DNA-directed RNA polymerase subunit RPC12/RpoP